MAQTTDHSVTALDIINDALRKCGVKDVEESITGAQTVEALRVLNNLVKSLQADGLHLWKQREIAVFYSPSRSFNLPGARAAYEYVQTTATGGSGTSLTVSDGDGLVVGQNIGVEIAGDLFWTTVADVEPLTLAEPMPSDPEPGAYVFSYSNGIARPLKLRAGRRIVLGSEAPIRMVAREEYLRLSNKDATGKVVEAYYDPQLSAGTLFVWPIMDSPKDVVQFTADVPLFDFDATTNNPDFPQEWFEPLVDMLAARLGTYYVIPASLQQMLKMQAMESRDRVLAWDREEASVMIEPVMS